MHLAFAHNKIVTSKTHMESNAFDEKRASPRENTLDISEILAGVNKQGFTCMVHDISQEGAKLEVTCGDIPDRFILANHIKRTKTMCRVMWRDGNYLGVKFLSRPRPFAISEEA